MWEFQAFDIVECIDEKPVHSRSKAMPQIGHLYRVQSVRKVGDGHSIRLLELTPECHAGGPCNCGNCGWDSGRFRLVHRPADDKLRAFREMLEWAPATEALEPTVSQ